MMIVYALAVVPLAITAYLFINWQHKRNEAEFVRRFRAFKRRTVLSADVSEYVEQVAANFTRSEIRRLMELK